MPKFFGTNGVRGRLDLYTPEFASSLAAAFGTWIKGGKVCVARDTRTTGETIQHAVVSGLLSVGCEPILLGIVPSPTAEFVHHSMKTNGLIIITASHNPPDWAALKFVDAKGLPVSSERGVEIEEIMEKNAFKRAAWDQIKTERVYHFAVRDHVEAILKHVNAEKVRKRKLKLVVDTGNGTTIAAVQMLAEKLGCELNTLNSQMDGHFPGRNSEPTKENVAGLLSAVKTLGADLGVAFDGDGDRIIFVDENGEYVIGDKTFVLCEEIILRGKKGPVVTTVATTNAAREIAQKHGQKLVYTKVGAPYLSEKIREIKGVTGGEEVGAVIWPELSLGKDGLMTMAKVVEAVAEKPFSKLIDALPKYCNYKTKLEAGPERFSQVSKFAEKIRREGASVIDIDGVRVDYKDAWAIVRASGTENYVRIFAEAKTPEKAEALAKEFLKKFRET